MGDVPYSDADAASDAARFVSVNYDTASVGLCGYDIGEGDILLQSREYQKLHEEVKRYSEMSRLFKYCVDASSDSKVSEKMIDICSDNNNNSNDNSNYNSASVSVSVGNSISNSNNSARYTRFLRSKSQSLPCEWPLSTEIADATSVASSLYSNDSLLTQATSRNNKKLEQIKRDYRSDTVLINGMLFQGSQLKDYIFPSLLNCMEGLCDKILVDCSYKADQITPKFFNFCNYCLLKASTTELGDSILMMCLENMLTSCHIIPLVGRNQPTKMRLFAQYEVTEDHRYVSPRCRIYCETDAVYVYEIVAKKESDDPDAADDDCYGTETEDVGSILLEARCVRSISVYVDSMDRFRSESKVLVSQISPLHD